MRNKGGNSSTALLLTGTEIMNAASQTSYRLAPFSADVTIPLGHRCMGILPRKSEKILDPLFAHGFVLLGSGEPIVYCAVDWCEIRNGAYDRWREVLAKAAGTRPQRVLVSSLHQHDAPVTDTGAENLLAKEGLAGELFDMPFHEQTLERVANALADSLESAQPVTHVGTGQAAVEKVASNRRVQLPNGQVHFERGSSSGGDPVLRDAPDGLIDPNLKTVSFWNGSTPLLALNAYATHPMSYYGRGEVSADFVGMARDRRQRDDLKVHQIYASGCSGDVTAGKYNDGSPANRELLADRIYRGMVEAWDATTTEPLTRVELRTTELLLEYRKDATHTAESLQRTLDNTQADVRDRILAAMGLSSRRRVAANQPIDFSCLDLGHAKIVLFPAEAFVRYQLLAQETAPDAFVCSIGYGECWPGYIPTASAFDDGFTNSWLWVAPGAEERVTTALKAVLKNA